jgi:hypothetical protein
MDRRKYLKTLALGTAGAGLLVQGCATDKKEVITDVPKTSTIDRTPQELAHEQKLLGERFFNDHETKTIHVLADIIIPKDELSGSATDAKVPEFIEFIVKDLPIHQTPMRGGLRWLDLQCMKRYDNAFIDCTSVQQFAMIDDIAFPETAKSELQQGVAFFNLMRDLTACGFFTSQMGIKDLGYAGNKPNQWDGVPQDVLQHYNIQYDERTLDESVKFS